MSKSLKVSPDDSNLLHVFSASMTAMLFLFAFVFILLPDPLSTMGRILVFWIAAFSCLFLYLSILVYANTLRRASLMVGMIRVKVLVGDPRKEKGHIVIGTYNDFSLINGLEFHVDDKFLKCLDDGIKPDVYFNGFKVDAATLKSEEENSYVMGTCHKVKDNMLVVMEKKSSGKVLETPIYEYITAWFSLWRTLDYLTDRNSSIVIPVESVIPMKFKGSLREPSYEEIIDIALWTLSKSGFTRNSYKTSVSFLVDKARAKEIDFFSLKHLSFLKR